MKKKKNLREGKKTAVTEEDIPTPKTENLRYVGPVTRMRARYAGDDWKREVDLSTDPTRPAYAVNAAGTNKSAAAGSTSLNTKRLHKDTEDLAFNAAGTNKSTAAGSTSLNIRKLYKDTEDLAYAKKERTKDGLLVINEDDYDFEYVWKKRRDPSDTFKIGTKKLSKAALEMRRMRFQMPWRPY